MRVAVIGTEKGVHETRFLRAFHERGFEAVFVSFNELSRASHVNPQVQKEPKIDFYFGGPLHQGLLIGPALEKAPFVAASYAFDVLHEAAKNTEAAAGVHRLLSLCCGLTVDCEAVARRTIENFGYKGPMLIRAWGLEKTGVPAAKSRSTEFTIEDPDSGRYVVSVRNFTELHGIMDVVRAFDYAASLNSKLRLLLAGDGPLKAEVRKLIDGLGLTSRVKLLGRVPESDIACLLRKAHVYVSAAVVDGTSISLLQALEAGTPVLLADVGGNPEWAARVDGAVLFKSGNWQELGKLMVAETSRETPGRFDRSAVLARHADWKRNSDDIVEFCLRVTSCSGPRAI